jgi:hypothetical protein
MTDPDRPTLDYAGPRTDTPPPPNGRRLIACAILTFCGVVLLGTKTGDVSEISGAVLTLIGILLFLIEYVRGWRSRDE